MSDRPLRSCDVCGGIDDHPRHIFLAQGTGQTFAVNEEAVQAAYNYEGEGSIAEIVAIVRDLQDLETITRHMDCCRSVGCPTGDCDNMPAEQHDLRGYKLVEAITGEKVK